MALKEPLPPAKPVTRPLRRRRPATRRRLRPPRPGKSRPRKRPRRRSDFAGGGRELAAGNRPGRAGFASHRGVGKSRGQIRPDAAQRRFPTGGTAGGPVAGGGLDDGKEISVRRRAGGTGRTRGYFGPAADVHERERRGGGRAGRVLSVAAGAAAGGGGRCGPAAGRDPDARARQQRRPSRAGIHRAASGVAGICAGCGSASGGRRTGGGKLPAMSSRRSTRRKRR